MNINLMIVSLLCIFFFILVIFLIKIKEKGYSKNLLELDNLLISLLNRSNFFSGTANSEIYLKSAQELQEALYRIKDNQEKWSQLFNQKFENTVKDFSNPKRNIYNEYSNSRKNLVESFIRELDLVIRNLQNAPVTDSLITDGLFAKCFFNGFYKPRFSPHHFVEMESILKRDMDILALDQKFVQLSKKEMFFSADNNSPFLEENYNKVISLISENYVSWKQKIKTLVTDPTSLSKEDRDYLNTRKIVYEQLLIDIENFISSELPNRKKLSPNVKWFYQKFNESGNLSEFIFYQNFLNNREKFYQIRGL